MKGPWKLHAVILIMVLTLMLCCTSTPAADTLHPPLTDHTLLSIDHLPADINTCKLHDILPGADAFQETSQHSDFLCLSSHHPPAEPTSQLHGLCPVTEPSTNDIINVSSKLSSLMNNDTVQYPFSPFCQEKLLQIGGVEQKPGPTPSPEDVLCELCAKAPDNEVRDCLRLYDPKLRINQRSKKMSNINKPVLIATSVYLQMEDQNRYNKDTCLEHVIQRIENLLPNECNICSEQYCVELEHKPLLTCESCGLGSHNECVLRNIPVADVTAEELGELGAKQIINPTGWIGFHYLCGKCSKKTLFDKEKGLLKKASKNSTSEAQEEVHNDVLDESYIPPSQLGNDTVPPPGGPGGEPDSQKKPNPRKICRFYKQGTCKHGLRGKDCKFDHPVACKKLLKHGNRTPDGCTLGEKCQNYHPKMCVSSLKKKECYRATCKLVHVTGTKRKKAESENKNDKRSSSPLISQGTDQTPPAEATKQNPFLEALQAMRKDIMMEIDQRLASLQPKSYMSLNKENTSKPLKPTLAWQQNQQAPTGGQMLGTPMPTTQGMLQGQQVLLVPMQMPL